MAQVGHLDGLDEKYGPRGFKVVAISAAPRSSIQEFITKSSAKHAIVIVEDQTLDEFGVKGFPTSYLLGPDGRIVWTGHPANLQDSAIEAQLENVRLRPELPAKLAPVGKAVEKGKYGDALCKLLPLLQATSLTDEERAAAEKAKEWLDWKGTNGLASAQKDVEAGRVYQGWLGYDALAQSFKGTEVAGTAAKAIAALLADKDHKREVDAGKKLDKAREQAKDLSDEKAAKLYEQIAKKYEGTKAGARAATLAAELAAK